MAKVNSVFILGKKCIYSLAKEASLKLKEVAYICGEAYSASALKHGPYSLIEVGNQLFLSYQKMILIITYVIQYQKLELGNLTDHLR